MPSLLGYRKFTVAVLFVIAATYLCATGKLSGDNFVSIAWSVTGLFGAANAISKAFTSKTKDTVTGTS